MSKKTYPIVGMHCASCAQIIKTKLEKIPEIKTVNINYVSEEAILEFNSKSEPIKKINNELLKLGYHLQNTQDHSDTTLNKANKEEKHDYNNEKANFYLAVPASILVFLWMLYEIMASSIDFLPEIIIPMGIMNGTLMIIATVVLFGPGRRFLSALLRFIRYGAANMDTLIGLGTVSAYVYSLVIFSYPDLKAILSLPNFYYFDATIVVIGFVILGKYLENNAKQKSGAAIKALMSLQADKAIRKNGVKEEEIKASDILVGDILVVKPGMKIATDGIVIEGSSSVNESMISGEAMPVDKQIGSKLIGGTLNTQGFILMKAEKIGADTVLAKIIQLVKEAQNSRAPIQKLSDRIASIFVPIVLAIASLSFLTWIIIGPFFYSSSLSLSLAISALVGVLVIACPCALGLATPTALMVAIGRGAKNGILIKNAEALEKLKNIDTIVFDKTGTLTTGNVSVSAYYSLNDKMNAQQVLTLAAALESRSEHPLATAIVKEANKEQLDYNSLKMEDFQAHSGQGVSAIIDGKKIVAQKSQNNSHTQAQAHIQAGDTIIDILWDNQVIGMIACNDVIKKEAKSALKQLKSQSKKIIMLTGDRFEAAQKIANSLEITDFQANVLPEDKARIIKELQAKGHKIAMIGDGINDAPALAQADSGIAMASGTDVALVTADITIIGSRLDKLSEAFHLSRITFNTVKENLFWASIYNLIGIPLAAGLFYPLFGISLNPAFAGAAMAMSSVSVVLNSLRLNLKK
jgi:Cu2+-exporting ATPase/Cu+-exporting ATPase